MSKVQIYQKGPFGRAFLCQRALFRWVRHPYSSQPNCMAPSKVVVGNVDCKNFTKSALLAGSFGPYSSKPNCMAPSRGVVGDVTCCVCVRVCVCVCVCMCVCLCVYIVKKCVGKCKLLKFVKKPDASFICIGEFNSEQKLFFLPVPPPSRRCHVLRRPLRPPPLRRCVCVCV